jgi:16S rRNA (uracil1498-N3)-methyltransferase
MTRPRFFHPSAGSRVRIDREEPAYHYFLRVVRVRPGEDVVLFRGDGVDYVYRLAGADSRGLDLSLTEKVQVDSDPDLVLTLLLAVLKGDRVSDVIRSVVPLGVGRLIPFLSARGVRRPGESYVSRWTTVADQAVRQCGRTRPPEILRVCDSLDEGLSTVRRLAKGSFAGLVFWEEAETRLEQALGEIERKMRSMEGSEVVCVIGPEGGLTREEVQVAVETGLLPCRMGARILRSELAAVVAAALIQHRLGDLR